MNKYIFLLLIAVNFLTCYAQPVASPDTAKLSDTNTIRFSLLQNDRGTKIAVSQYVINGVRYLPSNSSRVIRNFGTILIKTNGTGSFRPAVSVTSGLVNYTIKDSRGRVSSSRLVFVTPTVTPPPTSTPGVFSYSWKGSVGNTSAVDYGKSKFKALRSPTSVSELNGFVYVTTGFVEGNSSIFKTPISNPTQRIEVPARTSNDFVLEGVCGVSDGTRFYLVGFDPYGRAVNGGTGYSSKIDCAVVAYDINDNEVTFQYGQSISCTLQDNPYKSAIAVVRNDTNQLPIKLTVDNQFLYVYTRTQIKKYDKVSGLYISMAPNTESGFISTYSRNGNTITMTATNVTYNGNVICSAQTSPKVNLYTYTPKDFNTFKTKGYVYIGNDGSLYVCDAGNSRILKYSSAGLYINQIAYVPMNYNCSVDRNNPTRVFAGFLEYKVTYPSLTWELVNNWSYNINKAYTPNEQVLGALRHVITVNNETFAIVDSFLQFSDYSMRYPSKVKLTSTGMKTVKIFDPFENVWLDLQGNEYVADCGNELNSYNTLYKNGVQVERSPIITSSSASYLDDGGFAVTADGHYVVYNNMNNAKANYHIEWIKNGAVINRAAQALAGTQSTYPTTDRFMVDGVSGEPASKGIAVCNDIAAFMYTGEGFQNSQTTKLHIYKGRQFQRIIGKTYEEAIAVDGTEAPREFAGNAFAGNLVSVNGIYYYFFNCEHTGALQCFIISGL